jgi:hypothetical protein
LEARAAEEEKLKSFEKSKVKNVLENKQSEKSNNENEDKAKEVVTEIIIPQSKIVEVK